jgi:Flp pilus assembly protein TadD
MQVLLSLAINLGFLTEKLRPYLATSLMVWAGIAKLQLNADAEAIAWLRRSLDANRNYPLAHFLLAAALARLGELDHAKAAVQTGLAVESVLHRPPFRCRHQCA